MTWSDPKIMTRQIVVIGGGWAGLAAAVRLCAEGFSVAVLEALPVAGGRARSLPARGGEGKLDWGQHLFLGGYRRTKELLDLLGTRHSLRRVEGPVPFYARGGKGGRVRVLPLPAPLHLLGSMLDLSHLGLKARLELGRMALAFFLNPPSRGDLERTTAEAWLRSCGQGDEVIARFWRPIVVSALNEEPGAASASMLEVVLREGIFAGGTEAAPELPEVSLGELVAEPAARYIEQRGGVVRTRGAVKGLRMEGGRARAAVLRGGSEVEADTFIIAVGPWDAAPLLRSIGSPRALRVSGDLELFRPSPIVTLYVRTGRALIAGAYAGLLDGHFHWVFNRSRRAGGSGGGIHRYSFVCSAAHSLLGKTRDQLKAMAEEDIRSHLPGGEEADIFVTRVVVDRKATFSPAPCLTPRRPGHDALADHEVLLAGDWTGTGLPATLEGAVASGFRCAEAVIGQ